MISRAAASSTGEGETYRDWVNQTTRNLWNAPAPTPVFLTHQKPTLPLNPCPPGEDLRIGRNRRPDFGRAELALRLDRLLWTSASPNV